MTKKILILGGKLSVTVGLFCLLASMIMSEYKEVKGMLPRSLSDFTVDPQTVQSRARTVTINHFMPSFDYLVEFEKDQKDLNAEKLEEYAHYYKKVVEYMPGRSDAYSMLGFCYYHLGKKQEAIDSYKRAVALNPQFFWSNYNLAVILFKEGRHAESLEMVRKAVAIPPGHTMLFMQTSKIYQDIIRKMSSPAQVIQEGLQSGYRDCRLLLGFNQYYLRNFSLKTAAVLEENKIDVRVF